MSCHERSRRWPLGQTIIRKDVVGVGGYSPWGAASRVVVALLAMLRATLKFVQKAHPGRLIGFAAVMLTVYFTAPVVIVPSVIAWTALVTHQQQPPVDILSPLCVPMG